jgi:hypothetical protein
MASLSPFDFLEKSLIIVAIGNSLECNVSIICGSLPEIRPFFMQFIRKERTTTTAHNLTAYQLSNMPHMGGTRTAEPSSFHRTQRDVKAGSNDSLGQFYGWAGGQDSSTHFKDQNTIALNELPMSNATKMEMAGNIKQSATSEAGGSHGSEEMWVNGGDGPHQRKNKPDTPV